MNPFSVGEWIWTKDTGHNAYVLFVKNVPLRTGMEALRFRIAASYHYELYLNGSFVARGPVHGDPLWCQYDDIVHTLDDSSPMLCIAILVHHSSDTHLHYLLPAPGGVIAEFESGGRVFGTDESWKCLQLEMWNRDVPARGWALDYCEDYDAALEPQGWGEKVFPPHAVDAWPSAVLVEGADATWGGYQRRMTPRPRRRFVTPVRFKAYRATQLGASDIGDVSRYCDQEALVPTSGMLPFDLEALNAQLASANAVTLDLGREQVGFYAMDVEAPAGTVIEMSGAELLRDGRPWIFRKGTRYSVRYRTRSGRQQFASFAWSGFRYLHLVIRGGSEGVRLHRVGCLARQVPLTYSGAFHTEDETLQRVFDLCRDTLEVGVQEHLIDCPTREQTQYWGDALFIAESLWVGFDERSHMEWYLEGFLHAPLKDNGQLSSTYPGEHITLLDYSLIPLLGQVFYRAQTGAYYKPQETFTKALRLKRWYDDRVGDDGLVSFNYETYAEQGLLTFVDHPGIGWHDFPHPGIDRHGASCPLNTFFYAFVRTLSEMAEFLGRPEAGALRQQADGLAASIRRRFFRGGVFHDALAEGCLSEGTSWQTNALAVFSGLISGQEAADVIGAMIEGYDRLCRCSPYFYFYFLPALRLAGLEREALELIKREWRPMLDGGATTTWEGFLGDDKDSLCHPWSTAPFLFLLRSCEGWGGERPDSQAGGRKESVE